MAVTIDNENNANNTAVMRMLAQLNIHKWAELIKSLKTHTPQQSVSRPTNVLSLSWDNVSIKTQKYAHFQRFRRAIFAAFSQKAADWKDALDKSLWRQRSAHWSDLPLRVPVEGTYTGIRCCQNCNGSDAGVTGGLLRNSIRYTCSFQTGQCH